MIPLATLIERFESDYLRQYGASSLPSHTKALGAMKRCRTQLAPRMLAHCGACDEQRVVPHSCGHRNCPHCQHHESQQRIERQLARQVPAAYFMLTFTVPAELRELAWRHQSWFYAKLFDCAWETVNTFSRNDKKLRCSAGAAHPFAPPGLPPACASGDACGGARCPEPCMAHQVRPGRQGD